MTTSSLRGLLAAMVIGTILVGGSGLSLAQSAGDSITARRALMQGNNSHFKAIRAFVKKGTGSAAEVAVHAQSIAIHAGILPGLFPQGTSLNDGAGKTRAKPDIWRNWSGFKVRVASLKAEATKLSQAAKSGDKSAIAAAFGSLGKNACGACHRQFRGPRK